MDRKYEIFKDKGRPFVNKWLNKRKEIGKLKAWKEMQDLDKVDYTLLLPNGETATLEIKYREKYNINDKPIQDGIFLEDEKFNYMKDTQSKSGYTHTYYMAFFKDMNAVLYDLSDKEFNDFTWQETELIYKNYSSYADERKTKRKIMTKLKINDGKKFNMEQ